MLANKFRFIWQSGFRGEGLKKSVNQKQELSVVAMFVNGSGQNEQSLERTFHRCFLPSFTSFGWGVSEEKIKMWKVNGRRTPSDGKSSHWRWQGELKRTIQRNWHHRVHKKKEKTKHKHNLICVGHHYVQTNINNLNKTWALLQTTGGKDEPTIVSWNLLEYSGIKWFFPQIFCIS